MVRADRAARHERAAEWLQGLQEDRDQLLEVVADHYLQALQYREAGGEDCTTLIAQARGPIRDAGRKADALGAFPAALRLLGQAVDMWPERDAARGAVLLAYGQCQLGAGIEGEAALREAIELLTTARGLELLADAQVTLTVLLYRRGDVAGSDAALASAYETIADAPPSPTKTTVLGLMARTALERGDAERSLRLAREAETTAAAGPDVPFHVVAYAGRQVGLAEIALGDPDAIARIRDPIPELERQRLLSAAASHRSDLAGTLIELGRLGEAATVVDELLDSGQPGWARDHRGGRQCRSGRRCATGRVTGTQHAPPPTWSASARAQAVVPQNWPLALIALAEGKDELADQLSADALAAARRDVDVWCRVTAATLRAYVLVGRDNVQAAELVAEAADHWSQSAPIFGVLVPVAAEVYLQLGQAAEGERAIAAIRMPSHWQEAAQLALAGKAALAADRYRQIGSLPDAASALARAGRLSDAAAIWRSLGATAHLARAATPPSIDGSVCAMQAALNNGA